MITLVYFCRIEAIPTKEKSWEEMSRRKDLEIDLAGIGLVFL
jgi:hypothetical protein